MYVGLLLFAIIGLAAVLRLVHLGQDSFRGDEILSVQRAQLEWGAFSVLLREIPNMAFYYLLLHIWIPLGDSEATVRTLSILTAVATLPVIYLLGRRLFSASIGLTAALLLAINAFHIQYSQEARSYSLLVLLITLSSLLFVRSIEGRSWSSWIGYAVISSLAIYAHWFALLVIFAHFSSLFALPRTAIPWKGLATSLAVIGVLLFPFFIAILSNSGARVWLGEPSVHDVYSVAIALTGSGGVLLALIYLITLAAMGVVTAKKWSSSRGSVGSWRFIFLVMWLLQPIGVSLGYSLLVTPAFLSSISRS